MNHRSGELRRAYGRAVAGAGALLSAKRLLDAFNAHDAAAMGALAAPDLAEADADADREGP